MWECFPLTTTSVKSKTKCLFGALRATARPSHGGGLAAGSECFKQLKTCYLWHSVWSMMSLWLQMWMNTVEEFLEMVCKLIGKKLLTRANLVRVVCQGSWLCHEDALKIALPQFSGKISVMTQERNDVRFREHLSSLVQCVSARIPVRKAGLWLQNSIHYWQSKSGNAHGSLHTITFMRIIPDVIYFLNE